MSYPPKTFSAAQRRRLSRLEREHKVLVASNTALKREVKTLAAQIRSETYQEASAAVLGDVYDSLKDFGIAGAQWMSQRLLASRERRKPAGLDPKIERLVVLEIAAHLKKCGQRSYLRALQRSHGAKLGVVL